MDQIERIVTYYGGFSLGDFFFYLNRKGMLQILLFIPDDDLRTGTKFKQSAQLNHLLVVA